MKGLSIVNWDNSPPGWLKRNLVMALLIVVASLVGGLAFGQPAEAFGNGGSVTGIAGKCLENKDGIVATGNKVQLGACDSSTKQVWQWQGDMSIRVQGYCLDVQTSGTTPGTTVQLWTCNGTGAQRWYKQTDGTLKNQNSNLCLQTVGSASANGTGVEINTCNAGNSAQVWTISSDAIVEVPLFDGAAHNPLPAGPFQAPAPTITLDYSKMPQWGNYMEQVAKPFMQDWYRAMADHYLPGKSVIPAFTITVDPSYSGAATTLSQTRSMRFNPGLYGYTTQQPHLQRTLIHEMHHMLIFNEALNGSNLPVWLIEGLAEEASYEFYGSTKPGLSANSHFVNGYLASEAVITRAQQQSGGTFLSALNNAGWNNTFSYGIFDQTSGSTPAEHWKTLTSDAVVSEVGNLVNALSNKCVELPSNNGSDGVRMQLDSCSGTNSDDQNWGFRALQGNSAGIVTSVYGSRCLSVESNGTAAGTAVAYRTCNAASNPGQKWEFVGGTLRNPNSGKCLQPVGGAQINGTLLEIQSCNGLTIQQWKMPPIVKDSPTAVTSKVLYPATFSDGQQGIGTTDAKGGGYNRILTAPANSTYVKPNLSPNGALVAYFQTTAGQQNVTLRKANADGTGSTQLTVSGHFMTTSAPRPVWSADSSKILIAATPTGQTATDKQWTWLWVNADGSGQQVLSGSVIGGTPFAAANNKIYFVNDGAGEQQLCSVSDTNGTGEACFGSAAVPKATALSPDGSRVTSLANGTTTSIQVTTISGGTTSSVSLSGLGSGLTNVEDVTWMPNTTKVAFRAVVSGRTAWYAIDVVNPGQITKLNIDASSMTWYASAAPSLVNGAYNALTPYRITDTRTGLGGLNAGKTLAPGATLDIQVAGLGGVPAEGASAVVLNITEAATTSNGYITVYPTGTTQPNASTLNNTAGKILNNQTTVGLGADGKVSIFNQLGNTDMVVDVVGYYGETGGSFTLTAPKRVIDTRDGGGAPVAAWSSKNVQVTGVQGIPSSATGIVADVTEVGATGTGYLTVYPAGASLPAASNMNFSASETLTKEVSARLSAGGALTVYNGSPGTTHFIVDVVGYYTNDMGGMTYTSINPSRIADTRAGSGQPYAGQPLTVGLTKSFAIGSTLMPANASGVVNNLTVPSASNPATYLVAFPANVGTVPGATSVTFVSPVAFNQSTVQLSGGPTGGFKIYNHQGTTELVIDSLGYYY